MPLLTATGLAVDAAGAGPPPLAGPVDLTLQAGEVVSVEGPSGCGKTTLLRALACLDPLGRGEVALGEGAATGDGIPAFRRRVVYLPQQPPALRGTVSESLARPFTFRAARQAARRGGDRSPGRGTAWDPERAAPLLRRLRLPGDVLDRRLGDLSVGEAQRVALVRALMAEPAVLLLDEPTTALDPAAKAVAEALVGAWLAAGDRGAVLVSHDPDQIRRLATRRLALEGGRLVPVADAGGAPGGGAPEGTR